ncbi:hypothetical protein BH11GEM2_BH11GEM2_04920 [soil metagenome]
MSGIKTLLCRIEVDTAKSSHTCRRNEAHKIAKGERRLKVRDGRSWKHYCLDCARQILMRDTEKLREGLEVINLPEAVGKIGVGTRFGAEAGI